MDRKQSRISVHTMTRIALSTAVICILGPLSLVIPVSPVPVSFGILGIFLAVYLNDAYYGVLSCLLYILIGFAGVPVFAGFTAGLGKLAGPTGGYIIGYLPLSLIAGFFVSRYEHNIPMQVLGMVLGTLSCYLIGTAWLSVSAHMSFSAALMAGVIPFVPADAVKIFAAVHIGIPVRAGVRRFSEAGQ